MRRSTAPGADGWPCSGVVRNRYADEDATAPAAMTPLMKPRRDTDSDVSGIFLSSIAGSPRRVVNRPDGEGLSRGNNNPVRGFGSMIFHRLSGSPHVCECPRVREAVGGQKPPKKG